MANPIKGEVSFDFKGATYTAVLNTNARIEIESAYGRGFASIVMDALGVSGQADLPADATELQKTLAKARTMEVAHTRHFLFHALRQHHPDIAIDTVGFMMDDLGTDRVNALISDMLQLSEAPADAGDEGKGSAGSKPKS